MLNRTSILRQLEPGLNTIFGEAYSGYENEHAVLFDVSNSNRAFEEDVLMPGFDAAVVKDEGSGITYAETQEAWVSRYNHETIALAFAITEEAMEDNLYESLSARLSKCLARAMAHTKQVKAANVYNNAFSGSYLGGDGVALLATNHPLQSGSTLANKPTTDVDLSETALEDALIAIAGFTDDRDIPIAAMGKSLHIPRQLVYVAERILKSPARVGTADNDLNALASTGSLPGGVFLNHRFTDPDAWFIRTDVPDSMRMFERVKIKTAMEGDFNTGNVRYKSRERYSFGWSDPRGLYGSQGA